jgi:cytochrome P450
MSRAAIFSFMPILTKILPESVTNIERGRYYRNRFHEISEKWIREHRQDYRGNRTGDLQDAYLEKVNAGEETFTEQGLAAILRELFVIGSESESVMLRWAVRILACHPEVQERMREEAVRVVGKGTEVTWDRRTELPYTMAVMKEIQRFADIVPTGLIHKTLADTELAGYNLPANTLVMCNISACHRCPDFWEKPEEFHPEHFLGAEGELLEGKEGFLPYGVGTRVCPGAELADMKMFLIIANLVLAFKLGLPEGDEGDLGTQFEAGTAVLRNPKPSRTTFESI